MPRNAPKDSRTGIRLSSGCVASASGCHPRNGLGLRWYLFCKRTGHGDLGSRPETLVEGHLTEIAGHAGHDEAAKIGFFLLVGSDRRRRALEYMEKGYQAEPSALHGIARVLLADELGDRARRDRMLDEVSAQFQGKVPKMVTICKMISDHAGRQRQVPTQPRGRRHDTRPDARQESSKRRLPRRRIPAQPPPA